MMENVKKVNTVNVLRFFTAHSVMNIQTRLCITYATPVQLAPGVWVLDKTAAGVRIPKQEETCPVAVPFSSFWPLHPLPQLCSPGSSWSQCPGSRVRQQSSRGRAGVVAWMTQCFQVMKTQMQAASERRRKAAPSHCSTAEPERSSLSGSQGSFPAHFPHTSPPPSNPAFGGR